MQEGHIVGIEFFVSRGNTPKVLDAREEAFDQVAIFVQMGVVGPELRSVGARRDYRLRAVDLDEPNQSIGIVALVCDDRIGLDARDQLRGALDIGNLARTQYQSQRIAQSKASTAV